MHCGVSACRRQRERLLLRKKNRVGRQLARLSVRPYRETRGERYALLLHTLEQPVTEVVKLYDARGGAIESDIQQDKLGRQLLRRRKRSWHAQKAWVIMDILAVVLFIWHSRNL